MCRNTNIELFGKVLDIVTMFQFLYTFWRMNVWLHRPTVCQNGTGYSQTFVFPYLFFWGIHLPLSQNWKRLFKPNLLLSRQHFPTPYLFNLESQKYFHTHISSKVCFSWRTTIKTPENEKKKSLENKKREKLS